MENKLYIYRAEVIRVIDGDSMIALVDLGFNTWKKVNIRFFGVDAYETRTKDVKEKERGFKAKERVIEVLKENGNKFLLKSRGVGKFGRCLGEIYIKSLGDVSLQNLLLNEGHAVKYVI